jgi:hypothetical protein
MENGNKIEKFNLERALAGEPFCTRDRNEVTQLTYFQETDDLFIVGGVLDRELYLWQTNGRFLQTKEDAKDLFIKPKENAIWVNLYKDYNGKLFTGCSHDSEKEAVEAIGGYPKIRTIKIVE